MQLKHFSGAGDVVAILCGIRFPSRMPRSGVCDAELMQTAQRHWQEPLLILEGH